MPEPKPIGTYMQPAHGWTCFHCGETFTTENSARDHFGEYPGTEPACIDRAKHSAAELLRRARRAEYEAKRAYGLSNEADERAGGAMAEVAGFLARFKDARTLQDVWNRYDTMEGRALAAEAIVREAEKLDPNVIAKARDTVCAPPAEETAARA